MKREQALFAALQAMYEAAHPAHIDDFFRQKLINARELAREALSLSDTSVATEGRAEASLFPVAHIEIGDDFEDVVTVDQAKAYATNAVMEEREACAKVCETLRFSELGPTEAAKHQRNLCAAAIRARSKK